MLSQGVLFTVLINTTNTAYLFTIHEKLAKELTNEKNQKNSLFIYIKVCVKCSFIQCQNRFSVL